MLRQATPSWLGALAPRITNATRRLEREPSTLGVEAQFGELSCGFWRPISQEITTESRGEVGGQQWLEKSLYEVWLRANALDDHWKKEERV